MRLSGREKLAVAVGIAAGLLILLKLFASPFAGKDGPLDEGVEARAELLKRYLRVSAERPEAEAKLEALRERIGSLENSLFSSSTPGVASAQLQGRLERIVKLRNARIRSVKTLKPEDIGEYTKIGVEITFYTDMRSLLNLLYDIEGESQGLSVAELDIRLRNGPGQQRLLTMLKVESGLRNEGG